MARYRVILETGASSVIEVEADDEESAEMLAHDEAPFVCAQCSGWGQRAGIEIGDWETGDIEKIGD